MAHDKEPTHDLEQRFYEQQNSLRERLNPEGSVIVASRVDEGTQKEEKLILHQQGWVVTRGEYAHPIEHATPFHIAQQFASLQDPEYRSIEADIDHTNPNADYVAWDARMKSYLLQNRRRLLSELVDSMEAASITEQPTVAA